MYSDISLEKAIELIEDNVSAITETKLVNTEAAFSSLAAEDVSIGFDQPPFPRSPLDGFAVRSIDTKGASHETPKCFRIIDTVYAGGCSSCTVDEMEAVRIMTGAPIPDGADCIIRQEDIIGWKDEERFTPFKVGDTVKIPYEFHKWDNYCFKGEDVKKDTVVLKDRTRIGYIEEGILASSGITHVNVYRKPRVSVLVTGSELVEPGEKLAPGKIYDSNLFMMKYRLRELNCDVVMAEQVPDEVRAGASLFRKAAEISDLVITSGGVSVGEKDIIHLILPEIGADKIFWGIRMKPGSPAIFSKSGDVPMIHLSGNPFAALATFELLVRPALVKLTGDEGYKVREVEAVLDEDFMKHRGRRFIRGFYNEGHVRFPAPVAQASGILFSMQGCNCLIELPPSDVPYMKGTKVKVHLI
ncbi:molybdopterin molybdotransferase MoeA [Oribacterium sp. WCC10]|uniref:molybdopterin molybdotransferase MoeA n=1 Tax=Oribacterium sp. WCC10 TaxID=1855343 RepID=UPI0008EE2237|nr:gephyrin-like molybdotransferase Glp [Oribacterium sp. WCC10]SFG18933.1 molybdopterin molybdotransferase [Oribacterium sp. WCC10]